MISCYLREHDIGHIPVSIYWVSGLFFLIAFFYATVGLGGGTAYTALLTMFGFPFTAIPTISLSLNLLVTTAGSANYLVRRYGRFDLIAPFLFTSLPLAYLGGALHVSREIFFLILFLTLIVIAYRIYFGKISFDSPNPGRTGKIVLSLLVGAVLGFLAGVTGIGGGIFLVPAIILLGLGTSREAAAAGTVFIWCNSLIGLVARLQYHHFDFSQIFPLAIAVTIGGSLGSYLGATKLSPDSLQKLLGIIILIAIFFLGRELLSLMTYSL